MREDKIIRILFIATVFAGFAIIDYFDAWWPGIMAVFMVALGLRSFLMRNYAAMLTNILIFGGIFIFGFSNALEEYIPQKMILPAIFLLIGLVLILRVLISKR